MMKYLLINGSPREKNTWNVMKQAQKRIDGDFEEIHLIAENIPMCIGCFNCILEGEEKCPHFNKINPIVEKIKKSDGIIIGSPVYAMNVSGILKNLFDHTAYFYHRPEFFTKKALVVVTTAGAGHKKVANYIDETLRHWGVNKVYKYSVVCGGKDSLEDDAIDKIAEKFSRDVNSNKLHSPKLGDIVFFNVWKSLALLNDPIKKDAEYWKQTGLINHDFAPEVKLNPVKKVFSKLMSFVLKKVMK